MRSEELGRARFLKSKKISKRLSIIQKEKMVVRFRRDKEHVLIDLLYVYNIDHVVLSPYCSTYRYKKHVGSLG